MSGIENCYAKERNNTFFRRSFFVSVPKKIVGEHFGISEKFGYRKTSCLRGRYHFSPLFPGLLPIKFVGEPLCFRIFGTSKMFMLSRGGIAIFRWFFLASQYLQIAWVTPSTFRKFSGIETFYGWERKITFFGRIFLSHGTQKTPGNHFYVSEYLGSRKLLCISRFSSDFFVSQYRKTSWGAI